MGAGELCLSRSVLIALICENKVLLMVFADRLEIYR
jgi:hypothetical protein